MPNHFSSLVVGQSRAPATGGRSRGVPARARQRDRGLSGQGELSPVLGARDPRLRSSAQERATSNDTEAPISSRDGVYRLEHSGDFEVGEDGNLVPKIHEDSVGLLEATGAGFRVDLAGLRDALLGSVRVEELTGVYPAATVASDAISITIPTTSPDVNQEVVDAIASLEAKVNELNDKLRTVEDERGV